MRETDEKASKSRPYEVQPLKSIKADEASSADKQSLTHEQQLEIANQRLRAHEQQLRAANQQLKAANQQLRAHEQQLKTANQQFQAHEKLLETANHQLIALNQQLLAREQQLDAANQQLRAHEQQLETANQNLKALNQQLDAANQQLKAVNQQLRAHEQQLQGANQQLVANEEQLKKAKCDAEAASSAKSQFLANMSHEIRTPLNTIISISKILHKLDVDNLTVKQLEGCEIIYKSARRLLALINDILDLSKIESGKMEVQSASFSLDAQIAVIKSMAKTLIGEKKIVFSIQKSPLTPDTIVSDVYKLHEIITNIISNAIKFTDRGRIVLKIYVEGDKLYFEVSDTGIGISRHEIEHIFEEFTQVDSSNTRKYPGTGLGLAICKKMVELLAGQIKAESEPGMGTVIKFWIPLKTTPAEAGGGLTESPECNRAKPETVSLPGDVAGDSSACEVLSKILIAEDDEFGRAALRMMLEHKYQLIFAKDGQEVVEKYFSVSPDIVLMDIMMPVMDGYQAFGEINKKSSKPLIPIIALTAKAMIEDRDQLLGFGFSDYVSKPIDDDTLIKTIDKYLTGTNRGLT